MAEQYPGSLCSAQPWAAGGLPRCSLDGGASAAWFDLLLCPLNTCSPNNVTHADHFLPPLSGRVQAHVCPCYSPTQSLITILMPTSLLPSSVFCCLQPPSAVLWTLSHWHFAFFADFTLAHIFPNISKLWLLFIPFTSTSLAQPTSYSWVSEITPYPVLSLYPSWSFSIQQRENVWWMK